METDTGLRAVNNGARLLWPQVLLCALFALNMTAFPVPYAGAVRVSFVLMAVYYWAIYRPTLVPSSLCFFTGLLMDVLSGMPPGLNAVVILLVQRVVKSQRRFLMGQPYIAIWAMFGLVAVAAAAMQWLLFGFSGWRWTGGMPAAAGAAASLLLFPAATLALIAVHRRLPVAPRGYGRV